MKEYLDPTDWSLKLVNVDNDAARPDWIEVPEGANRYIKSDGVTGFVKHYAKLNPDIWDAERELWRSGYYEGNDLILWCRQKPRVRVYATLSQSKFERDLQALKELLIEERPILEALRSVLDKVITEAAADWSGPGWREAARKQILEDWQPDWSFAPEGYDWYAVDSDGEGTFTNYEPFMFCGRWAPPYSSHRTGIKKFRLPGVNFNYQGDWRDSLRKRPATEWQPDWTRAPKGCDWFAVDSDGTGTFMNYEPEMLCGTWVAPSSTTHPIIKARPGTNFGYQGDWRDSLRKCKKIGGVIIL